MGDLLSVISDSKRLNENYDVWQFIKFLVGIKKRVKFVCPKQNGQKSNLKFLLHFAHHVSIDLLHFEYKTSLITKLKN